MLFLAGSRDALADPDLLKFECDRLGESATLVSIDHADHAFHVPARSGRSNDQVRRELIDVLGGWILRIGD